MLDELRRSVVQKAPLTFTTTALEWVDLLQVITFTLKSVRSFMQPA